MDKVVGKCILCGTPVTGVRRGKLYCSEAHRKRYSRLNPDKRTTQQRVTRTSDSAKKVVICAVHSVDRTTCTDKLHQEDNWCFAHELEPKWCTMQKGQHVYGTK